MGYDFFFHFIKDDLIDPNIAFMQNVDNFLFCIYFNYFGRYESDIKKERNILLADLFRNIKTSLMGGIMEMGYKKIDIEEIVEEILKEEDEEERKSKLFGLNFKVDLSFMFPSSLDKLIYLKYNCKKIDYAEMEVDLILYCILVNGLSKTKGEKFDQIKKEMEPLTKKLKEMFCEFDKNEIYQERTFIFQLRSPSGSHDDYYIINYKDDLLRKYSEDDEIKIMFLHTNRNKDEEDERKFTYCSIVLEESLHCGKEEYKL